MNHPPIPFLRTALCHVTVRIAHAPVPLGPQPPRKQCLSLVTTSFAQHISNDVYRVGPSNSTSFMVQLRTLRKWSHKVAKPVSGACAGRPKWRVRREEEAAQCLPASARRDRPEDTKTGYSCRTRTLVPDTKPQCLQSASRRRLQCGIHAACVAAIQRPLQHSPGDCLYLPQQHVVRLKFVPTCLKRRIFVQTGTSCVALRSLGVAARQVQSTCIVSTPQSTPQALSGLFRQSVRSLLIWRRPYDTRILLRFFEEKC